MLNKTILLHCRGNEPLEARGYEYTYISESFENVLRFGMSDSSGPHSLEELESKVEKIMDMMSQLLEAKSAGGVQKREEEESGGTGRGTAYNYSGGAG